MTEQKEDAVVPASGKPEKSGQKRSTGKDSNTPVTVQHATSDPMIEAVGLSKFYGVFTAIQDVSFQVRKGELVAFLGPNGSGKSTTMKILTGYLSASEGVARIAGHDMALDRLAGSSRL